MPVLAAARLLKSLGNPLPNSVKLFTALEVLKLTKARAWIAKVTQTLIQHWQKTNAAKQNCLADGSPNKYSSWINVFVAMGG